MYPPITTPVRRLCIRAGSVLFFSAAGGFAAAFAGAADYQAAVLSALLAVFAAVDAAADRIRWAIEDSQLRSLGYRDATELRRHLEDNRAA